MNVKYGALAEALDYLRRSAQLEDDSGIDLSVREEDVQKGILGECIVVRYTGTYEPSQYDRMRSKETREYTLEVFADHENRAPRITCVETRDLEFK